MGLFQRQDQHRDNSRDVNQISASDAGGNEHEAHEGQVQDGSRSVSDKEPQNQHGGLDRAEETNSDVSEDRLQDNGVSIQASDQASDGEFPEHHSLEAIFFDPEPDIKSKWQPHKAISNYITKFFSKK